MFGFRFRFRLPSSLIFIDYEKWAQRHLYYTCRTDPYKTVFAGQCKCHRYYYSTTQKTREKAFRAIYKKYNRKH